MKVFVIVVTYNGMKWYDRCFGSLVASAIPLEVVVVDNASTDGTVGYLNEHFLAAKVIANDSNLGFGQANNAGMKYALENGADYVFLLNQDAWVESDTIGALVETHHNHPEYGILSCIHLNPERNRIWQLNCICNEQITDSLLVNDLYFGRLKDVYDTKYVNAAAWLLPRKTLETVGGFDPIFFHYGEDDNYINRVLYHGLKVGICPKERIVHDMRLDRPLYDTREREILMLIDYTNPNVDRSVGKDVRKHLWKAFTSLLRGRGKAYRNHLVDYRLLRKNGKAIEKSVNTNRQPGPHWI